MIFFKRKKRRL